jgi:hypothetical protein
VTNLSGDMKKILSQTIIKEHRDDYSIVYIDPGEGEKARKVLRNLKPYSSITYTVDEVSVVLRSAEWESFKENFRDHKEEGPYRLFTFDIVIDLSIVGFLSVISTALAESGVSVYAISTYLKDHILVKKRDAAKALSVLNGLITSAKT